MEPRQQTELFFAEYARRSNEALQNPPREDLDGIATAFAPFFVGAGPRGVNGGANNDAFRTLIQQGFAHYRRIGGKSMQVTRVKVTELDAFNVMARVDWLFSYERPIDRRHGQIAFQNIYFLNFADQSPQVFAYITPDEEQAMRDHGLI